MSLLAAGIYCSNESTKNNEIQNNRVNVSMYFQFQVLKNLHFKKHRQIQLFLNFAKQRDTFKCSLELLHFVGMQLGWPYFFHRDSILGYNLKRQGFNYYTV